MLMTSLGTWCIYIYTCRQNTQIYKINLYKIVLASHIMHTTNIHLKYICIILSVVHITYNYVYYEYAHINISHVIAVCVCLAIHCTVCKGEPVSLFSFLMKQAAPKRTKSLLRKGLVQGVQFVSIGASLQ